jgi:hypothetical protein
MRPLPRFARQCDKEYVIGEKYRLEAVEERSHASHGHYFSCVADAWNSLPEHLADKFPSSEHLRAYALCMAKDGKWATKRVIPCRDEEQLLKLSAYVRGWQKFAVIIPDRDNLVLEVREAMSQSTRKMTARDFQASKTDVLDFIEDLIGVPAGHFARQA